MPTLWRAAPSNDLTLRRELIDPRIKGNFERYFASNTKDLLWVGEPEQMDRRLVAQSGTFVVPGVLDKPLDDIIGCYESGNTLLKKIVLPPSIREEAMLSLYRMNITHATLFPDLDGLARSIGYEPLWRRPKKPAPDPAAACPARSRPFAVSVSS